MSGTYPDKNLGVVLMFWRLEKQKFKKWRLRLFSLLANIAVNFWLKLAV